MEFKELLQLVHLGELDVVDSRINEQLDMLEKVLGVISVPVDNTLSTSGMEWEVSGSVLCSWMVPHTCVGVIIALIDHAHQLFLYLNFSLIRTIF